MAGADLDGKGRYMGHVMTVRGPLDPELLGPTLTHEHIFWDARNSWDPSELENPETGSLPFEPRFGGLARWNGSAFRDDLHQSPETEYELVADEVSEFVDAGGSCIVELSNVGLNPSPDGLRRLSESLSVHIVEGCGFYVHGSHPGWVEDASVDEIEAFLHAEIETGIAGSAIRPGIIGEIGTSETLFPCEQRILQAAARAARRTATAVNVHAHPPELPVLMSILDLLEGEGHDLRKTSVSHLDEIADIDYHVAVLERGITTGFDSFGQDGYFTPTWKSRSDLAKMTTLVTLIERGYEDQLVLSQDMGKKHYLLRFGGMGYDHVLRRIVPRLRTSFAVTDSVIEKLLVTNPRRLLTRERDPEMVA
jgi:phosphotriesterase-related protein